MDPVFPYEERLENALHELRSAPLFDVTYEYIESAGDEALDVDLMFQDLADGGYPIDRRLQRCYFRHRNVAILWRTRNIDAVLAGEFDVKNIATTPDLPVSVEGFSRERSDRRLLSELCVLDDLSLGGNRSLVTVHLQEGTTDPEIWFLDRYRPYVRLELDYCEYLDNLLISKGVYGWQYLFADVDLRERDFSHVLNNLQMMMDMFPRQFPDHDYAPFAARLEARL